MHARVSRQVLELLRRVQELVDLGLAVVDRPEARLGAQRLVDARALARTELRDEPREATRVDGRHAHDAPDVPHHALALELMEGGDLPDGVMPVFVADVVDHVLAFAHAEVDVEVGHRHALRVQEAFEEQAVGEGVEVGDAQRVGDQRAGARATSGADGDVRLLRPTDEVLDDQEVAGEAHRIDDVELEIQARAILSFVRIQPATSRFTQALLQTRG